MYQPVSYTHLNKAWYRMARLGADFYQELTSNLENDGYDTSFYDQSGVVDVYKRQAFWSKHG